MSAIAPFLDRESVALTDDQWLAIDTAVEATARRVLIGRRLLPIYGPLGPGAQTVPLDVYTGAYEGQADLTGEADCGLLRSSGTRFVPIPILHKDFQLNWRQVAAAQDGIPLDLAPATTAAAYTARKEDDLIFNGDTALGLEGILTAAGRTVQRLGDWQATGQAYSDIVAATETLNGKGFFGPYALVTSPGQYALMHRVQERTGVLEWRNVQELVTAGIYSSPVIAPGQVAVVSVGMQHMDLALAQDMVVAAMGPEKMNPQLRVLESVVPRIKRPDAILTLEAEA